MTPDPTQSNLLTALRRFLLDVLPDGVEVISANDNRVPEPKGASAIMTPRSFVRLATNIDKTVDLKMTGSISGNLMTITDVSPWSSGTVKVGTVIFGVGVAAKTTVAALGSGTGGVGTYTVTPSQTVAEETLSGGRLRIVQSVQATVQIDFHSDPAAAIQAADMAQTFATLFRDEYAVSSFANQVLAYGVTPLYAGDPREVPFVNDQQQYEWRWVVEAEMQIYTAVEVPQEYADSAEVGLIEVDERYPP